MNTLGSGDHTHATSLNCCYRAKQPYPTYEGMSMSISQSNLIYKNRWAAKFGPRVSAH